MADPRTTLAGWLDGDEAEIVDFVAAFTRAKSPNPPGDTREAAAVVGRLLEANGISYELVGPDAQKPNVVATFDGHEPGPHVVFNGHIDTYPVDPYGWTRDPFGGEVDGGRIYG